MSPSPAGPVAAIAEQVASLRTGRGWTAQDLAEKMTAAGFKWDRFVVRNVEQGRRKSIGVDELLGLARVLGVAPVHLLVPIDESEFAEYAVTPVEVAKVGRVREWARGRTPYLADRGAEVEREMGSEEWMTYLSHMPTQERSRLFRSVVGTSSIGDSMAEVEQDLARKTRQIEQLDEEYAERREHATRNADEDSGQ